MVSETSHAVESDLNFSLADVIGKKTPLFPQNTVGKKKKNKNKKKRRGGANGSIVRTAYGMLKGYVNDPGQKKTEENVKLLKQVLEILEKVEPKSKPTPKAPAQAEVA